MLKNLSQSQKAIQRVVFKLYERWGDKKNKYQLIIFLIKNPQNSSKEEKQLISTLIAYKNNSEEFEPNLQMISNLFEQYIEQKKEMLTELTAGKVQKANQIKNILIQQNNSIKDEINTSYENILTSSAIREKENIDQLISSKKFKLAHEFLNSSEVLAPQHEYYKNKINHLALNFEKENIDQLISSKKFKLAHEYLNSSEILAPQHKYYKNKIDHLALNFEKQQQILDLFEKELSDEILKDQMLALWKELELPSKDMQYLISEVSAKVIQLIDDKKLYQAEKIIKDILIHLQLFPEALHVSLLAKKESSFKKMISDIQQLINSKRFDEAFQYLETYELTGSQAIDLSNKIEKSSRGEEIKTEIINKINEKSFSDAYRLIKNTMFSNKDNKEINETLITVLKNTLEVDEIDSDQAMAIICDKQFQLISARAGSGKTTTLINKVKLLISLNKIDLSEYLFLVFNNKIRKEISKKIAATFSINEDEVKNTNVHTFHSFAGRVGSSSFQGYSLAEGEAQSQLYRKCFQECLKNSNFNSLYRKYLTTIVNPQGDDIDKFDRTNYGSDEEYFAARSGARLLTLNNINVKSLGEKLIGDFFFEHQTTYTYEPTRITKDNKIYRPDFYINNLTDTENKKIYIELWGIYKDEFNNSQSAPFDISDYRRERLKKLDYWKENEWNSYLVEFFMDDIYKNNLNPHKDFLAFKENFFEVIKNKLEPVIGKKFRRLSETEIMEKVSKLFESKILASLMSYIQNVRNNQIKPEELNAKIDEFNEHLTSRSKAFLDLGHQFRAAIWKEKQSAKLIEFVDSVDMAGKSIEQEGIELIKNKKYLFVDEFQDTNFGFLNIVKAIVKSNPSIHVICVGDDWQSINSFMGARTSIYHSLDKYLPGLEKNQILTNYRSGSSIVNYGNSVMKGLGEPSKSSMDFGSIHYIDIFNVRNSEGFNIYIDSDKNKYDDGFKLQRYHKSLFCLIKYEISKYIDTNSSKSIYDIPKNAKLLILSRNKKINHESIEYALLPIVLNTLTKYFLSIGYKEDRQEIYSRLNGLISYSSIHAIKGGEADAVFLIEANANNMPMQHPDRELSTIFWDNPRTSDAEADAEERRLYYVAVTRAKNSLYVVASASEKSMFMSDKSFTSIENFNTS
jgi:DNA helicase-4